MRLLRLITLMLMVGGLLALPASAAAGWKDVIRDCARDGDLDRNYSERELRQAYNNLPTDIDEYTNCRDVIRQALAAGNRNSSGGNGTGGSGGYGYGGTGTGFRPRPSGEDPSAGGTAGDREALAQREAAARNGVTPFDDRAAAVRAARASGDGSGVPAPAIAAIILLVLAALGGGLYLMRDRLPPQLVSRLPGFGPGQGG